MPLSPNEARQLLLDLLNEIQAAERLDEEARSPVTLDQESVGRLSRIDAMQLQAMALASQRRRLQLKSQIEAALRRLNENEFGYCIKCGEEITELRLRNSPATPFCIDCAD